MINNIIKELQADNGKLYKLDVLKKHQDNKLLQRVLKMCFDKATFTYGVSMKNIDPDIPDRQSTYPRSLEQCLDILEEGFVTRLHTGHDALDVLGDMIFSLNTDDREVLKGIINRDLRINMGRTQINKVFKGLIVKPVYMRCGTFNKKAAMKIDPNGAFVQLKADGTYREFTVEDGHVTCNSRSGEDYDYPIFFDIMKDYPDGHYIGELTVVRDGIVLPRAEGNGIIKAERETENWRLDLWDYVTLEAYTLAIDKIEGTIPYHERWDSLNNIIGLFYSNSKIQPVETWIVDSFQEALERCVFWMNLGLEGAILKDRNAIFRDGNSPQQLKLKLEIDADVRITGFKEGKPGTIREQSFGAMTFENDDGNIKGACSGFSKPQLKDFNSRREELIGKIITVCCNDITQAKNNDFYALSHPRFIEIRDDKDETDTLERVLETKEMAMAIKI